jgi:hypothetical protein
MKHAHEARVELACGIPPDKQSHVLLYGANIADHRTNLAYKTAAPAILPRRYPARDPFIVQAKDNHRRDQTDEYWPEERKHLLEKFEARIRPVLANGDDPHVSVFALAPQPLLVLLGSLLTDIANVDVYQRHREPLPSWCWPPVRDDLAPLGFELLRPRSFEMRPVLVLSLSATVTSDRIARVMGDNYAEWRVTLHRPNRDCIQTPQDLCAWRQFLRHLLDEIKAAHGQGIPLHVFPAMPVSTAIELGRVRQPKADMPLLVYDETPGRGFVPAISIA